MNLKEMLRNLDRKMATMCAETYHGFFYGRADSHICIYAGKLEPEHALDFCPHIRHEHAVGIPEGKYLCTIVGGQNGTK